VAATFYSADFRIMKTNFSTNLIVAFSKGLINFAFNSLTGTYEKKLRLLLMMF
jgi:hypothetical protein